MADHRFEDLKLNRQLLAAMADLGWSEPTEIQYRSIPPILANQNLIGIAPSGTGKSGAYLVPLIMRTKFAEGTEPRVLILVPTKELAVQVGEQAKALGRHTDLRISSVYGGVGPKRQVEALAEGVDFLISTPGRLLELYARGSAGFRKVKVLVLDEADRMMDMGFLPQLRRILDVLPVRRQNLLFSATFPAHVERLSQSFLDNPVRLEVRPPATPADTIEQCLYYVPNLKTKINLLSYFLDRRQEYEKVVIFCRTKETANNICGFIDRKGLGPVRVIHSNKDQNTRMNAVREFAGDTLRVLVSTDVTARGIDIPDVSHVINFDVPLHPSDYVHRIGRTGRARREGTALTFCTPAEEYTIQKTEELIRRKVPVFDLPPGVELGDSTKEEEIWQAREIDRHKKLRDPEFRGAFHEKKGRRK